MNIPDELLDRYGRAGPRYTSYPTVPHWTEQVGAPQLRTALRNLREPSPTQDGVISGTRKRPVELYVHLPFCKRPCSFCGCNFVVMNKQEPVEAYLDRIEEEMRAVSDELDGGAEVVGLHFGGGTPTHLSIEKLDRLLDSLERHFSFTEQAERSIEVHPHVTRREQLQFLAERGFERISLGVQDLTPEVQRRIHRHQTAEETRGLMEDARALGFVSLNVDLIYGLPLQSVEGLVDTARFVVDAGADRLAVYGYAHVPWLKKNQRGIRESELPSPALRRDLYRAVTDELVTLGFRSIGLDHFARPEDELFRAQEDGRLGRGFMGYTVRHAEDLIGLGPSAIGDVAGTFGQNAPELLEWHDRVAETGLGTVRGLVTDAEDRLRRAVIEAALCLLRVDLVSIGERFGVDGCDHFATELAALAPFEDDGLVVRDERGFSLTETGRYLSRNVAMVFDAYLRTEQSQGPRYSQTV